MNNKLDNMLKRAWDRMFDEDMYHDIITSRIPELNNPKEINFSVVKTRSGNCMLTISNFLKAVKYSDRASTATRFLIRWIQSIMPVVRLVGETPDSIVMIIPCSERIDEVAVPVYRRNGRGGLTMKYKCIAGRKKGKTVSRPDICMKAPDIKKRSVLSRNKIKSKGYSSTKKKLSRMNDISYKKMKKANQRLKKSRGF